MKAVHLEVKGKQYLARTELSGRRGWRCRRGWWPCSGYVPLIAPEMLTPRQNLYLAVSNLGYTRR